MVEPLPPLVLHLPMPSISYPLCFCSCAPESKRGDEKEDEYICLCMRNFEGIGAEIGSREASGCIKYSATDSEPPPSFFFRELSAMEPSDSASTAMEEPDSLEVLVKTLDSQTRTFIVGAQVRHQYFVEGCA